MRDTLVKGGKGNFYSFHEGAAIPELELDEHELLVRPACSRK